MNLLRKLLLILMIVVFLEAVLWTTPSYSIQAESSCCLPNESICRYNEKGPTEQLPLGSKDYPQGDNCYCILNQLSNINVILSSWIDLEEEKSLSFIQDVSKITISLSKEDRITCLDNKSTFNYLSLFLLKSSFLL